MRLDPDAADHGDEHAPDREQRASGRGAGEQDREPRDRLNARQRAGGGSSSARCRFSQSRIRP